jgi:bifunctional DNA-binding transcriptional regulator/antitoxin component of YhaV-PrlF toxin-antitoxin module
MSKSRDIVHAYSTRKDEGTTVLVIPKMLKEEMGISTGDEFLVKRVGEDRIVYRKLAGNTRTT